MDLSSISSLSHIVEQSTDMVHFPALFLPVVSSLLFPQPHSKIHMLIIKTNNFPVILFFIFCFPFSYYINNNCNNHNNCCNNAYYYLGSVRLILLSIYIINLSLFFSDFCIITCIIF